MLYFAYGANLCRTHMALWCPESQPVGRADLPDHRLVFRFWADIVPAPGHTVPGALYDVTERDLAALDEYEDCPALYERVRVTVQEADGRREAMTYRMRPGYNLAPPEADYWHLLVRGYRDWNLSGETLESRPS